MIIHVGSQNQVKVEAVKEVFVHYDLFSAAEVKGVKVSSEVSAQPLTLEETITGAKMRAVRAFPGSAYAVGLESGAHRIVDERYMELTVCSIYDGKKHHLGYSSAFEIPPQMAKLLLRGFTLERACVEAGLTQNQQIGKAGGSIQILSHGKLTRKEYTKQAIVTALFSLQNPQLYIIY
ncbi:MAG TPA: inosine/xanthosine triphosphatase [Candidatus Nanoarchaeia archaeon]|nr:inosine/xanthosine triphosphatase [Candidatus Nanoarchaeia archaeon]